MVFGKYTATIHRTIDGLLGGVLIVQPFLAAHSADWIGFGVPEQWVVAVLGGALILSQALRMAAALIDMVDPPAMLTGLQRVLRGTP